MTLFSAGHRLIHPTVLETLARTGHKGRILITDALYSTATATHPRTRVVHLALTAGTPTVTEVLRALTEAISVEELTRMRPESGETALAVHREVDAVIPAEQTSHVWVPRAEFYDLASQPEVALCLATGDTRRFANLLLTVGVPEDPRERIGDQQGEETPAHVPDRPACHHHPRTVQRKPAYRTGARRRPGNASHDSAPPGADA